MKSSRRWRECSIADLPEEVLIDILSRLSIKSIVTCRCVSKTWRNLLSSSNSQFTKLHFSKSPVQFILETSYDPKVCSHIVELEDDTDVDNTIKCFPSRFKLSTFELVAVNSCNGFLCLGGKSRYPVKVCNPITGEYFNIPNHKMYDYKRRRNYGAVSGFGFCSKTNQYKVVMLAYRKEYNPVTVIGDRMVEVYTIGTNSWRTIETAPKNLDGICHATFFNGAIHWVCCDTRSSDYIISFDLESEKFGIVPPPTHFSMEPIPLISRYSLDIGVLGEFLYLLYKKELWVMKEYGVQESWTKMYVLDRYPQQVIKYLSGGKILMKYNGRLFSYDPAKSTYKKFKVPPFFWKVKIIAHVPSFMSFNDAMMGDNGAKIRTRMCRAQLKGRD